MRYGIIRITKEMMMERLAMGKDVFCSKKIRLLTDIPDDIEIIDAGWDKNRQVILLYVRGSGSPLYKVPEGEQIPCVDFNWEEVKE